MSIGRDDTIAGAKIEPLESPIKSNVAHELTDRGAVGTNHSIDRARIDPLGGHGQYQHPAPHANSQGVVGRDDVLAGAKVAPLEGKHGETIAKTAGLDDEAVDAARIAPMGEVREQMQ
ncbi:hypothetical protein DIS24_g113 [Lasiodiplodia hormozganensis]|uniref:Uncharacterized protein n=2 Tax=Lasiodiplodia TaxID=66739 RepID=A0A5N5DAB2_9PEZI|nr:hypothetical protein DBV05_g6776 [Lasiodiplodia theobromae]KAK0665083.1 hypothetical protein DIS24_g113 [Lasiodiplodia hormozganensis]